MTPTRPTLVCASANPDKVAEIERLLAGAVVLLPRPASIPDVVEDADTLVGNARLKAAAIVTAVGLPAVADDTGLEVDAPDPTARTPTTATSFSARWPGPTTGGAASAPSPWSSGPTDASWRSRACARVRSASMSGGVGGGATTHCSFPPTVMAARSPR